MNPEKANQAETKKGKTMCRILAFVLILIMSSISYADVIGDWEDSSGDDWIDNTNSLSIADPNNAAMYSLLSSSTGATLGTYSLAVSPGSGWKQCLRINLESKTGAVADFLANTQFRIDVTYNSGDWPADTTYAQVYEVALNESGYGWHDIGGAHDQTGANGAVFYDTLNPGYPGGLPLVDPGIPGTTLTGTWIWDYSGIKSQITATPSEGYIQFIFALNSNQAGIYYFDNARLVTLPATSPSPADEATGVGLTPTLSWTAGGDALSTDGHNVYFGTDFSDVNDADVNSAGIYLDTTTDPNYEITTPLEDYTEYYWRVDEVNDVSATKGTVWSFTTVNTSAINPDPADDESGVALTPLLSWTAGGSAADTDGHDVYLGTDFSDVNDADTGTAGIYLDTTTDPNYQIVTELDYDTVYYWRVDEVNGVDSWKGDVWQFTTESLYTLTIAKCSVKAGKTQGADADDIANIKDSFTASGTFDDVPDDLNTVSDLDLTLVSLDGNDTEVYSETISFGDYYDPVKNRFKYTHKVTKSDPNGAITSLMLNFSKDPMTFSIKTKNIDLTGLACPLQLNMWLDDMRYSGIASESIVNGSRKTIPTRLMRMFDDTLIVTKAKATSEKLSVKGEIAVEDIINDDLDEPNLVVSDVNIIWGAQTFTLSAGSFVAKKTGHKYKCSKVDVSDDGDDGLVTAQFDLDKCTFKLSIKGADSLDTGDTANVEFGINYGDADFDEVVDVNLPTGSSI
ncbi:MAG: hypothetical protein JW749_06395 [Sedimentisphaerales bacterium]|nr:hypothetical protein [Sedimentisphaerales bacterium]